MPVYEYFCPICNSKFELLRPVNRAGEKVSCPQCQGEAQRVFSPFIAFSRFAKVEEGSAPIAGTTSPCASCTAISCDTCH